MNAMLQFHQELLQFLKDDRPATLVLSGRSIDLGVATSFLDEVDNKDPEIAVILVSHPFEAPHLWLNTLVSSLEAQFEAVNQSRMAKGLDSWPTLEMECKTPKGSPVARMQRVVEHCVTHVAQEQVVWSLLPASCSDRAGYVQMVRPLLEAPDWAQGHKFVVADDAQDPSLVPWLENHPNPRVLVKELDFGPGAETDNWAKTALDPRTSDAERINMLTLLAATDLGRGRFKLAKEKLAFLLDLNQGTDLGRDVTTLTLMGDLAMRQEDFTLALTRYKNALGKIDQQESLDPTATLTTLIGTVRACIALERFQEGLGYAKLAKKAASKSLNVPGLIEVMVLRGRILEALAERTEDSTHLTNARDEYISAQGLSAKFGLEHSWKEALEHEIQVRKALEDESGAQQAQSRLDAGIDAAKIPPDHPSLAQALAKEPLS